jgi:hypothetical protein
VRGVGHVRADGSNTGVAGEARSHVCGRSRGRATHEPEARSQAGAFVAVSAAVVVADTTALFGKLQPHCCSARRVGWRIEPLEWELVVLGARAEDSWERY